MDDQQLKKKYFQKIISYAKHSKAERFKQIAVYRFMQERQQKLIKSIFRGWEELSIQKNRYQNMKAFHHYEEKLQEKVFDSLISYGIQTKKFKSKLMLFYYRFVLRKYYQELYFHKEEQRMHFEKKQLTLWRTIFINNFKKNKPKRQKKISEKEDDKIEKFQVQLFIEKVKKVCEGQNQKYSRLFLFMLRKIYQEHQIRKERSLSYSRRTISASSSQNSFSFSRRKHSVITQAVTLPDFHKSKSKIVPIKETKFQHENIQIQKKPKIQIERKPSIEDKIKLPPDQKGQEQEKKNIKSERQQKILGLLTKSKLLELKIMGNNFQFPKYQQLSKESLNLIKGK